MATGLGLIYAVLRSGCGGRRRSRWSFSLPMAISFLAAGVIFRLVYERDPDRGLGNAIVTTVMDPFRPDGSYAGANPRELLTAERGTLITPEGPSHRGGGAPRRGRSSSQRGARRRRAGHGPR